MARGRPRRAQCARAKVAELVDALDLGSSAARRAGSSPAFRMFRRCCRWRPGPLSAKLPRSARRAPAPGLPLIIEELPAMQVSVETLGNLERRMTFSLPAERLDTQVGGRLREIARTARIKGFRPGKVPAKVIEQRYGQQVRAEVLDGLLRESFDSAVREQALQPGRQPAASSRAPKRPARASWPTSPPSKSCRTSATSTSPSSTSSATPPRSRTPTSTR